MEDVEESLKRLLRGEIVPVGDTLDLQTKSALSPELERPIVKGTVTYIVMAMIFDDRGRVILIQEAKMSCHGQWYPPAGRVEPGENLIDAVKREVLEEAGIDFTPQTVDAVKREVLEEAGVEFEPLSVVNLQVQRSFNWFRLCYVGKAIGGRLKTLDQKDSESLQAGWFSTSEIKSGNLKLRYKDFFKSMDIAEQYLGFGAEKRHPLYNVGIQPYRNIIHRPLILRKVELGSIEVLCNVKKGQLLCCGANTHDNLASTIALIFTEVFNLKFSDGFPKLKFKGLLTIEHCGEPAREHDGMCITTVYKLPKRQQKKMDKPTNSDYAWVQISNSDLTGQLKNRALSKSKLLIPVI